VKLTIVAVLSGAILTASGEAQSYDCKPTHEHVCGSSGCNSLEQDEISNEQYSLNLASKKLDACMGSGCFSALLQTLPPDGMAWAGAGILRQQTSGNPTKIPPMTITFAIDKSTLAFSATWGQTVDSVRVLSGQCTINH